MMLTETELLHLLALLRVPNLGDASAKKLLHKSGSAEAVFKEKKQNLQKINGIGEFKLRDLDLKENFYEAENELRFIQQNKIQYSFFKDSSYPEKLKHCIDGPVLIFHKGNIDLKNKKLLSIVGTRQLTTYGKKFCEKLVEELSPMNPVIISGFAYGTDITAHLSAVKNGLQTIACLGHGFDRIYPGSHKKYVAEIEADGGFITEFWSSDPFAKTNFLKRNRIIAGLSEATVVIESAEKGGSLVTADIANSYNRDVFAVPGRADDSQSRGCNNLIKTNRAHLLTSAADILYLLNWEIEDPKPKTIQKQLFVELTEEEKTIYNFLKENKKEEMDTIALHCNMPVFKTATVLLNMELKGVVRPLPGKMFEIV